MTDDAALEPWRAVHVGFDHDEVEIGGLKVWQEAWRDVDGIRLRLGHPAYPDQLHDFRLYDIGPITQSVRFAACELSNTVWGFYVPA